MQESDAEGPSVVAGAGTPPRASVVIPCLNGGEGLTRCLEAVGRVRGIGICEVIVVDNGSTDDSCERAAAFPFVRLMVERERGAAAARNAGWRAARAPLIAFTDSDCEPSEAWLEDLLPMMDEDAGLAAVGGHILPGEQETVVSQYIEYRALFRQEDMVRDFWFSPPFVMTANAVYRRTALESLGGFDEGLWPHEDADLGWRAGWGGWRIGFAMRRGIVRHYHRTTVAALRRMMFQYGFGGADLFARHREKLGRRVWIDGWTYWRILVGLAKMPFCPVFAKGPMHRRRAMLDVVAYSAFAAGRLRAALKNRMLTL